MLFRIIHVYTVQIVATGEDVIITEVLIVNQQDLIDYMSRLSLHNTISFQFYFKGI